MSETMEQVHERWKKRTGHEKMVERVKPWVKRGVGAVAVVGALFVGDWYIDNQVEDASDTFRQDLSEELDEFVVNLTEEDFNQMGHELGEGIVEELDEAIRERLVLYLNTFGD